MFPTTDRKILIKFINNNTLTYITNKLCIKLNLTTGPWIAGGTARKLWFNEPWYEHDIDYFFNSHDEFKTASNAADEFMSVYRSAINDNMLDEHIKTNFVDPRFMRMSHHEFKTDNASSYRIKIKENNEEITGSVKIQLIRRQYYKSVEDIWNDFDFTICNFATDGNIVIADQQAINDCNHKVIRMNSLSVRRTDLKRVMKYTAYGFNPDSEILKNLNQQYNDKTILDNWDEDDEYQ